MAACIQRQRIQEWEHKLTNMPMYTYECRICEYTEALYFHMSEPKDDQACPMCKSGVMRHIFTPPQISTFTEFVTPNITGAPERISSRKKEKALCEKYGLVPVTHADQKIKRPSRGTKGHLPPIHEHMKQKLAELKG